MQHPCEISFFLDMTKQCIMKWRTMSSQYCILICSVPSPLARRHTPSSVIILISFVDEKLQLLLTSLSSRYKYSSTCTAAPKVHKSLIWTASIPSCHSCGLQAVTDNSLKSNKSPTFLLSSWYHGLSVQQNAARKHVRANVQV